MATRKTAKAIHSPLSATLKAAVDVVQKQGQAPMREQHAGSMQQSGMVQQPQPAQSGPQYVSAVASSVWNLG